jgi:hypothetical protein
MQENLPKTAQICQNLPKDETLKFRQKSRFSYFSKIKISMCREALEHVSTIWIFNPRIFHMLFLCQKTAFVCEFLHTPSWKINFLATFHTFGEYEILHTCT